MKIVIFVSLIILIASEVCKRLFGGITKGIHEVNGACVSFVVFLILCLFSILTELAAAIVFVIAVARLLLFGG